MSESIIQFKLNKPNKLVSLLSLPPLTLYVHFPWCTKKCPYCDFNSHAVTNNGSHQTNFDEALYLKALCADLEASLPLIWGRRIHAIFIGGGTPSLLSAAGLDQLLADIRARLPMDADIEITMEANPGSVEVQQFKAYQASGVNRLSLGIQSFNDQHLKALGRIHQADEARQAIRIAQQTFLRVNIDLMYGLPEQTTQQAMQDLKEALSFETGHISLYHLTLEPNTLFASFPPPLPDEDTTFEMQEILHQLLHQADYDRYEISAFAKKNQRCQHNLNYWKFGDYLGIGAGAHGKISFPDKIIRTIKERHPQSYMQSVFSPAKAMLEERQIDGHELPFEFMLNALRLIEGVPSADFLDRTGIDLSAIQKDLQVAVQKGLLTDSLTQIQATPLGLQFLNDLQEIFLPDLNTL
ncbi:MAG: radical SAM family heme chaperone HemW [Polynucleobacter sp.]|jgi:oxygen-independent coproporphyrinogen-3 oxidase|nr:radical SAM family heme chaperone HemW [Polynucleobacter sp.]